jgi:hypothetical protein
LESALTALGVAAKVRRVRLRLPGSLRGCGWVWVGWGALSVCLPASCIGALWQRAAADPSARCSRAAPQVLWAMASLQQHPGPSGMARVAAEVHVRLASGCERFSPLDLANVLWSFATLGCRPAEHDLKACRIGHLVPIWQP